MIKVLSIAARPELFSQLVRQCQIMLHGGELNDLGVDSAATISDQPNFLKMHTSCINRGTCAFSGHNFCFLAVLASR